MKLRPKFLTRFDFLTKDNTPNGYLFTFFGITLEANNYDVKIGLDFDYEDGEVVEYKKFNFWFVVHRFEIQLEVYF